MGGGSGVAFVRDGLHATSITRSYGRVLEVGGWGVVGQITTNKPPNRNELL